MDDDSSQHGIYLLIVHAPHQERTDVHLFPCRRTMNNWKAQHQEWHLDSCYVWFFLPETVLASYGFPYKHRPHP